MKWLQRSPFILSFSGLSAVALLAIGMRLLLRSRRPHPSRMAPPPAEAVALVSSASPAPAETAGRVNRALAAPADAGAPAQGEGTTAPDPTEAVVGNRQSLVFHAFDSQVLPAEENRAYFASEAEALAAGYHRSKHDRDRERPTQ